ncbi:MAG TPA: ABC transporter ATP-binding protein [Clostridia bacterium]|nr:ABC transporter ATP-binding protein [Clostridia bacterium]
MSNEIAIRVENLGKIFRIGIKEQRQETLMGSLAAMVRSPLRNYRELRKLSRFEDATADMVAPNAGKAPGERGAVKRGGARESASDTIWALKEVCFEVKHGEVVGIIGGNGAGKSTLLKVLARITEPTKGRAEIFGRVGSLLEVGTGFHPDLTGRENVYLNGTILGMRKYEVDEKFDAIVDFAGVEKFIDTPVKRYSSGMRVRLGFSVAAHLDPEILIVDEVLAVGDLEFQNKCLGKMREVAGGGRTVLFVSHNMGVISQLCSRGIVLSRGQVQVDGDIEQAVSAYLSQLDVLSTVPLHERKDRRGAGKVKLTHVNVVPQGTGSGSNIVSGSAVRFVFRLEGQVSATTGCMFTILDSRGARVSHFSSLVNGYGDLRDESNSKLFVCELQELCLMPGTYRINAAVMNGRDLEDHIESVITFEVVPGSFAGRPVTGSNASSLVCFRHKWIMPGV